MEFKLCVTNTIDIPDSNLETIIGTFTKMVQELLPRYINGVITYFAEDMIRSGSEILRCKRCGAQGTVRWKTKHGEPTTIVTIFQKVRINQLQVECTSCHHRFYITRKLLGIAPRKRITHGTRRKLGLIGALASFRVSEKITSMFGAKLDKMMIWRCVQETAEEIDFDLDPDEEAIGEADGTGIPIQGVKKRGKELKICVQRKKSGGIRVAGISIGNYDKDWGNLFQPLISTLKKFKKPFLLITDGDTGALKFLKGKVNILLQRCLWHIPYQFKYFLWKDGVKRKSSDWYFSLGRLFDICSIREYIEDNKLIDEIVRQKEKRLDFLINHCRKNGLKNCVSYLRNARGDMFSAILNRLQGFTTSYAERVMRTVNLRVNVGKWSAKGALNATKIRLAYYYNGWDV